MLDLTHCHPPGGASSGAGKEILHNFTFDFPYIRRSQYKNEFSNEFSSNWAQNEEAFGNCLCKVKKCSRLGSWKYQISVTCCVGKRLRTYARMKSKSSLSRYKLKEIPGIQLYSYHFAQEVPVPVGRRVELAAASLSRTYYWTAGLPHQPGLPTHQKNTPGFNTNFTFNLFALWSPWYC